MLTYLIYPDDYWPKPYYYWPLIIDIPPYHVVEPCETANWIIHELLEPTGNVVTNVDVPFAVHEELAPTGNTYFMTPDTPQVADSDDDGPYSIWQKAR